MIKKTFKTTVGAREFFDKHLKLTAIIKIEEESTIHYLKDGYYHRLDGPAFESEKGDFMWYKNGELHREDGPAYIKDDGSETWFINGTEYTEEEFKTWQRSQKLERFLND